MPDYKYQMSKLKQWGSADTLKIDSYFFYVFAVMSLLQEEKNVGRTVFVTLNTSEKN